MESRWLASLFFGPSIFLNTPLLANLVSLGGPCQEAGEFFFETQSSHAVDALAFAAVALKDVFINGLAFCSNTSGVYTRGKSSSRCWIVPRTSAFVRSQLWQSRTSFFSSYYPPELAARLQLLVDTPERSPPGYGGLGLSFCKTVMPQFHFRDSRIPSTARWRNSPMLKSRPNHPDTRWFAYGALPRCCGAGKNRHCLKPT